MFSDPVPNSDSSPVLAQASVELPLVLLYVAIKKDLPVIADLFTKEASAIGDLPSSLKGFKTMFSSIEELSGHHAFMVWLGKIALFEIELHQSDTLDSLQKDFVGENNDYIISWMTGDFDRAAFPVYVRGLQLCLDYFWKVFEVQRILVPVYAGFHKDQQVRLLTEAGLTRSPKRSDSKEPDLYLLSRP